MLANLYQLRKFLVRRDFISTYIKTLVFVSGIIGLFSYFVPPILGASPGRFWWVLVFGTLIPITLFVNEVIRHLKFIRSPYLYEFRHQTNKIKRRAQLKITGTGRTIERKEVSFVEQQIELGKAVLITGEAGTGKSGLGVMLIHNETNRENLLIDARQVSHIKDEPSLRRFYRCSEPIEKTISNIGEKKGFRIVIDQLDNAIDEPISTVLFELAIDCQKLENVDVIVISRRKEVSEKRLLDQLVYRGFAEIVSRQLDQEKAKEELEILGVTEPPGNLLRMSTNLLNLDIIATIKVNNPSFDFSGIAYEITLWEAYLETLVDRETNAGNLRLGEKILKEAMRLAETITKSEKQDLFLQSPLSKVQKRLVSFGLLIQIKGSSYRFKHENLQDYLFARSSVEKNLTAQQVIHEVGPIKSRNSIVWMDRIYSLEESDRRVILVREVLNG